MWKLYFGYCPKNLNPPLVMKKKNENMWEGRSFLRMPSTAGLLGILSFNLFQTQGGFSARHFEGKLHFFYR